MQTDPIGYDDGLNCYTYAHDDPVNMSDTTGTDSICGTMTFGISTANGYTVNVTYYPCGGEPAESAQNTGGIFNGGGPAGGAAGGVGAAGGTLRSVPQKNVRNYRRCPHPGTKLGNALQTAGTATQRAGGAVSLTGFALSISALGLPSAEVGPLSVVGAGAIVAGLGTAISLVGTGINFAATYDLGAAGIDVATNLVGYLGGRSLVAGQAVRGVLATEIGNDANTIAKMCP